MTDKRPNPSDAIAKHVAWVAEPITPMFITFVLGACLATAIVVGIFLPIRFPPTTVTFVVTLCTGLGVG